MNRYARGRRAEWKVRRHLEGAGAYVVRSAGSKGIVDLVAFFGDHVAVYQVKAGSARPTKRELAELCAFPCRRVRRFVVTVEKTVDFQEV